ncbi:TPA: hypothetical protein ACS70H_000487 [Providencia alcalifaciens]
MFRVTNESAGNIIELKVNGAAVCYLNTNDAVAADYLSFIAKTTETLMLDRNSLEQEANAFGKTTQHQYGAFSAIKDPKGL